MIDKRGEVAMSRFVNYLRHGLGMAPHCLRKCFHRQVMTINDVSLHYLFYFLGYGLLIGLGER